MNDLLAGFDPHQAAATITEWIGRAVLLGTFLAGATWVVTRFVSRRARPALHAALWIIVLFKFVVPFGPSLPLSLASTTHAATAWFSETFPPEATAALPTTDAGPPPAVVPPPAAVAAPPASQSARRCVRCFRA